MWSNFYILLRGLFLSLFKFILVVLGSLAMDWVCSWYCVLTRLGCVNELRILMLRMLWLMGKSWLLSLSLLLLLSFELFFTSSSFFLFLFLLLFLLFKKSFSLLLFLMKSLLFLLLSQAFLFLLSPALIFLSLLLLSECLLLSFFFLSNLSLGWSLLNWLLAGSLGLVRALRFLREFSWFTLRWGWNILETALPRKTLIGVVICSHGTFASLGTCSWFWSTACFWGGVACKVLGQVFGFFLILN